MINIKQFKLSSGEEIVCEVVATPEGEIVARKVIEVDSTVLDDGNRIYVMRPWMLYVDDLETITTISTANIVGSSNPSRELVNQYIVTMLSTIEAHHVRETHGDLTDEDLENMLEELVVSNKFLEASFEDTLEAIKLEKEARKEKDPTNIIYLTPS